jgi:hypothetical protein
MFFHKTSPLCRNIGSLSASPSLTACTRQMDITPISLLNTQYKILARILAHRLRHILADQLQIIQFCGVPGNSVLDAISSVRDVLVHYETTGTPLCILSLDLQNAFDLSPTNICLIFCRGTELVLGSKSESTPCTNMQRLPYKSLEIWQAPYPSRMAYDMGAY